MKFRCSSLVEFHRVQCSVLGPTLWNKLYDDLLRVRLPEGENYLAFADEVAIIVMIMIVISHYSSDL